MTEVTELHVWADFPHFLPKGVVARRAGSICSIEFKDRHVDFRCDDDGASLGPALPLLLSQLMSPDTKRPAPLDSGASGGEQDWTIQITYPILTDDGHRAMARSVFQTTAESLPAAYGKAAKSLGPAAKLGACLMGHHTLVP